MTKLHLKHLFWPALSLPVSLGCDCIYGRPFHHVPNMLALEVSTYCWSLSWKWVHIREEQWRGKCSPLGSSFLFLFFFSVWFEGVTEEAGWDIRTIGGFAGHSVLTDRGNKAQAAELVGQGGWWLGRALVWKQDCPFRTWILTLPWPWATCFTCLCSIVCEMRINYIFHKIERIK